MLKPIAYIVRYDIYIQTQIKESDGSKVKIWSGQHELFYANDKEEMAKMPTAIKRMRELKGMYRNVTDPIVLVESKRKH